ncbi:MurR/RpiR family transcriptional regulator [Tabrizicola sp.]|jgi:DNA-binding MurR/RpiR family transcriptional regulator|uniref:MurR/RpiR family transcriptional regulator n=1 Tax=Tabrizicola sp. TaxID=2005166 RepID=UPI001A4CB617|nr:MurR/RpiR family transcriptional regulator [Tabrizicola sp.]MBL9062821.1 MurR/RpiR family transcriptional regulator [Tabrizicola sp.]
MNEILPSAEESPLAARLRSVAGGLTKSEAIIAQWLILNESTLGLETGASIAARTGVSEITVSRFLKRAGYKGLQGLKEDLQAALVHAHVSPSDRYFRLLDGEIGAILKRDADAVLALAHEVEKPAWSQAIDAIAAADEVFVTGFQTIRGIAEDFARRLSIVRGSVRFLSPHDSGLVEWIPSFRRADEKRCLVMIDMAPYAHEALPIVQTARRLGLQVVVVTDELNTWAGSETPMVFHVATKVDAFLESTGPMTTLMNVIIHEVAGRAPEKARKRIKDWPPIMRGLGLY